MSTILTISIADKVMEEIEQLMQKENKKNKSEYVEELIRIGIINK